MAITRMIRPEILRLVFGYAPSFLSWAVVGESSPLESMHLLYHITFRNMFVSAYIPHESVLELVW